MKMAVEVVMPRLGWGGEEGSLVEWIKKDGDVVRPGDVICTVEGDKAVNEVESLDHGVLRIPPDSPAPGVKVPVGTLLAYLVAPGEKAPFEDGGVRAPEAAPESAVRSQTGRPDLLLGREGSTVPDLGVSPAPSLLNPGANGEGAGGHRGGQVIQASPRARRIAAELGVDWTALVGSGRTGRIVERDVRAAVAIETEPGGARFSPLVRRVAEDLGVDLEELARRNPGRRLTRSDVEVAAKARQPAAPAVIREAPLSGVRRVIARRMVESARTTAPVTLTTEADATDLARLREQLKKDRAGTDRSVPSYNDLFAKIVAIALKRHPSLNVSLVGDAIVRHAAVNVGIAVDTERGLLVPVLRDVQRKSIQQLASESGPLIERARGGRATSEDLGGATYTITNLGMYEIDAFTPIINLPEAAILGIGRIIAKPVVVEARETVAVRKMVALSLTFDHRLTDGAPAARFLQEVKRLVERPTLLIE